MKVVYIIVAIFNVLQEFTPFKATALSRRYRRPLKKRRTTIENEVNGDEEDVEVLDDGEEEMVAQQLHPEQPLLNPSYKVGM